MLRLVVTETGEILAECSSMTLINACQTQIALDCKETELSIPKLSVYEGEAVVKNFNGDAHINDLGLSVRAYNVLQRAHIKYVSDLYSLTITDLMTMRNLGRKCAAELLRKIAETL